MAKYKYVGGGYYAGLPTTDMTEDEWKSYPEELTKAALKSGLYVIDQPKPKKEVTNA